MRRLADLDKAGSTSAVLALKLFEDLTGRSASIRANNLDGQVRLDPQCHWIVARVARAAVQAHLAANSWHAAAASARRLAAIVSNIREGCLSPLHAEAVAMRAEAAGGAALEAEFIRPRSAARAWRLAAALAERASQEAAPLLGQEHPLLRQMNSLLADARAYEDGEASNSLPEEESAVIEPGTNT